MFKPLFIGFALAAGLLTGCASVPMASADADARAKTFTPAPDKANLYIYRNESFGAAVKMTVLLDDMLAGDTAANTYILRTLSPGRHTLASKTENDAKLEIDAVAGKNYFVWQEVKMGMMAAGSQLHLVDEATGKAAVAGCKLVEGTDSAMTPVAGMPVAATAMGADAPMAMPMSMPMAVEPSPAVAMPMPAAMPVPAAMPGAVLSPSSQAGLQLRRQPRLASDMATTLTDAAGFSRQGSLTNAEGDWVYLKGTGSQGWVLSSELAGSGFAL